MDRGGRSPTGTDIVVPMPPPDEHPVGVLLAQIGTPDSPSVPDVRRYLREFLSDPEVLDMAAPARWLLLNTVILPFRPRRTARAYAAIWTEDGSPLTLATDALVTGLREELGPDFVVTAATSTGHPSIVEGVRSLVEGGVARLVVVPLFPQFSRATSGGLAGRARRAAEELGRGSDLVVVPDFPDHPGFIGATVDLARPRLEEFDPDHVLFSYHGLPTRQIRQADPSGEWCLTSERCCDALTERNRHCYRAQCFATTRALVSALDLRPGEWSVAFQSRMRSQRWIGPFTEDTLESLRGEGHRRLAVFTPSFVADCLETLEEIGIRARDRWLDLGGEDFALIPSVNAHPLWVEGLATMVKYHAADGASH